MTPELKKYRDEQLAKANAGQNDYDKLVVALSGGALGLSFTFLKDVAKAQASSHPTLLLAAWGCWGLSVAFVLTSIYTGVRALRETVRQIDGGTIYKEKVGRGWSSVTALLNPGAGLLFMLGLVFMMTFVYFNPYGKGQQGSESGATRPASAQTKDKSASHSQDNSAAPPPLEPHR